MYKIEGRSHEVVTPSPPKICKIFDLFKTLHFQSALMDVIIFLTFYRGDFVGSGAHIPQNTYVPNFKIVCVGVCVCVRVKPSTPSSRN